MRFTLQQYWKLFARYMLAQKSMLALLGGVLVLDIGLRLVGPQVIAFFIDQATTGATLHTLLLIALLFLVVGGVELILNVLSVYIGAGIGWVATNALRVDLVSHCLKLDMPFHHMHTPGEMIERIDDDVKELNNFFSLFAVQLAGNILVILGVLLVLCCEDWPLGIIFLGFTVIAVTVFYRVRNVASPYWQRARQSNADLYGFLEDRLGGIIDLRTNGAGAYVMRRFSEVARVFFQATRRAIAMGVVVGNGSELILTLGSIAALSMGIVLYRVGMIPIGTVYLITAYAALITRPLQEIIGQIDDLQQATASIQRVQELLDERPVLVDGRGVSPGARPVAVEFRHVFFSYAPVPGRMNGAKNVALAGEPEEREETTDEERSEAMLQDISFQLAPGEILGLIGHTGSGKTTITRLLLRLYDPTAGQIFLNGIDVREMCLDELRECIGIVTQDVHLFHASVRDNLTLFDSGIPDEKIVSVLEELGLGEWYARLPRGLDTLLPPNGGGLSAGEAQLLAVVRVFLRDPGLIILDEASSRLDPISERLLDQAFTRLLTGRTAIIIAHRLRTIQRADTVLLLHQGCVQEWGPRERLAADPQSAFSRLLQLAGEDVLLQVTSE
jgi:ATP-binding cassette subfamily B protein